MSGSTGAKAPVIDCDVHQEVQSTAEVLGYMPAGWRAFVEEENPECIWPQFNWATPHGGYRHEAIPAGDAKPASSPELVRSGLLEPEGTTYAVLTHARGLYISGLPNPHLAGEVATALNQIVKDQWLDRDPAMLGSVVIANQVPERAAAEIKRWADCERMVQAVTAPNGVGQGMGHPIFDPIHRTLAECEMPLAIHGLGEGSAGAVSSPAASSLTVSFYTEFHTAAMQGMMTHLMSFILHGVFERYPGFKLVITEGGVTWLPAFLRRLDENYRGLRLEVPWCKKLPSEYLREHVFVTTQPFDIEGPSDPLLAPLAAYGLDDVIVFSSDYPHWDADSSDQIKRRLPAEWRDKVMWKNAARAYGLDAAQVLERQAEAARSPERAGTGATGE